MARNQRLTRAQVPSKRARRRWRARDEIATEPMWVGIVLLCAIVLWSTGPWIAGGVILVSLCVWLCRRFR